MASICETFKIPVIQKRRKLSNSEAYSSISESKTDENEGKSSRVLHFSTPKISRLSSVDSFCKFSLKIDENSSESSNDLQHLAEEIDDFLNENDSDYSSSASPSPIQKVSRRSLPVKKSRLRRIDSSSEEELINLSKKSSMLILINYSTKHCTKFILFYTRKITFCKDK